MVTLVSALVSQIETMVQEDATFSSGLWTIDPEILDYINDVQYEWIVKTQITKRVDPVTAVAGTRLYSDNANTMQSDRIDFLGIPLDRASRADLDLEDPGWRGKSGRPDQYHQDHLANKTFQVNRAPTAALVALGNFRTIATELPARVTGTGDNLSIPDYAVLYIKYGVLAKMFNKQGESQDLARANYCETRFEFGVELFLRLMGLETGAAEAVQGNGRRTQ